MNIIFEGVDTPAKSVAIAQIANNKSHNELVIYDNIDINTIDNIGKFIVVCLWYDMLIVYYDGVNKVSSLWSCTYDANIVSCVCDVIERERFDNLFVFMLVDPTIPNDRYTQTELEQLDEYYRGLCGKLISC